MKRPRVRDEDGELHLPSWVEFSAEDPLQQRALEQMVLGVSTRKYARSLEDVPEEVESRGTSKSAVSRRFKSATKKQLDALLQRDIGALEIAAVMLDGIYIEEHVILVAIGVEVEGTKHVLGLWEGATENHRVAIALLNDLVRRGLDSQRSTLFVVDGSGALRKAIRKVFGERGIIQRCQVHKRKNVLGHLPKEMHPSVGKALRDAYTSASHVAAKRTVGQPREAARERTPWRGQIAARGTRGDAHRQAHEALEVARADAIHDEYDRERQRRHPRHHPARQTLAGGSMILRWVAAGSHRAKQDLPSRTRLQSHPQARRLPTRERRTTRPCRCTPGWGRVDPHSQPRSRREVQHDAGQARWTSC